MSRTLKNLFPLYLNCALMLLGLEERFCTSFSCFSLRMRSASR